MKRFAIVFAAACAAAFWSAADIYLPGLSGEITNGGIMKGAVLASTNESQTATVKAVYEWPTYGVVSSETVERRVYEQLYQKIETLTNWCAYITDKFVVVSSSTNYYDGIQVVTNEALRQVERYVTNTTSKVEIVGLTAITNSLYTLEASGGVGTNGTKRLVGAGAKLLIESAPVTIFWE